MPASPNLKPENLLAGLAECRRHLDSGERIGALDAATVMRMLEATCGHYFAAVDAGDDEAAGFLYQVAEQFGALAGEYFEACEAYWAD